MQLFFNLVIENPEIYLGTPLFDCEYFMEDSAVMVIFKLEMVGGELAGVS